MNVKGPRLRHPKLEELKSLERFLSRLGLKVKEIAENVMALEVPKAKYVELFEVPMWVLELLDVLPFHYASGLYLGYVEKGRFKPGLPLARRLSSLCGRTFKCFVVDWEGEKRFLYGREVSERHIIEWTEGVSTVLNQIGEPLGWGRGVVRKGERVLKPLWDLGWYLRRGG